MPSLVLENLSTAIGRRETVSIIYLYHCFSLSSFRDMRMYYAKDQIEFSYYQRIHYSSYLNISKKTVRYRLNGDKIVSIISW